MSNRAIAPVVGVLTLLVLVTALGGVVAAVVPGTADGTDHLSAALDLEVHEAGDDWALRLTHTGGDPLELERLDLVVRIDEVELLHQPDVPFFNIRGFANGPRGVFNIGADGTWQAGQSGSFTILTSSNQPAIEPGDTVVVSVYFDDRLIAEASERVPR